MKRANRRHVIVGLAALVSVPLQAAWAQVQVTVPGWSDPWLAGMPDGSIASCHTNGVCDHAPAQSPLLVSGLRLVAGQGLTFTASGGVAEDPTYPLQPPDGSYAVPHIAGAQNGIGDLIAPFDALVGVFLSDEQPDSSPAPGGLNFGSLESRDYLTLSPLLKQPFFIGNGRTSEGVVQEVVVPAGATRLFLGTMDTTGWYNNIGSFAVTVTEPPVSVSPISWGAVKATYR